MLKIIARAAGLAALAAAVPATAQEVKLKPLVDARLRWDHVDQDGFADPADALTLRVRSGVQAERGPLSVLVEAEGVLAISGNYNDGFNGRRLPVIGDAQNVELNRAQLRYAANGFTATAGRQRIELLDQRFVGPAAWRQGEQTFDAARMQWSPFKRLTIDATYAWSVRTVNGIQGTPPRPQSIGGNNWFVVAGYAAPAGTLSGFAYLVDQDAAALSGYRLSSQTYGARFAGTRPIGHGLKLGYIASVARQSDYARNPNRYAATYWLGEASLTGRVISGTIGYEVLGASSGAVLTSVQTPLSSPFRFQGWAGKFVTTPPDGVRDGYATVAANWKAPHGAISAYGLGATWHRFDSDRAARHYGDEVDLIASAKLRKYTIAARYAHYSADRFAVDTDKLFVSIDWLFG